MIKDGFRVEVEKSMAQQEFCQACRQKNDCEKVYGKVCGAKGPSVTLPVVLAFLLPLVVFIASLSVFTNVLPGAKDETGAPTAVSLLPALFVTVACIWSTRALRRRFGHGG